MRIKTKPVKYVSWELAKPGKYHYNPQRTIEDFIEWPNTVKIKTVVIRKAIINVSALVLLHVQQVVATTRTGVLD